jgi:FlaA1/EpsC-like NDP-sugar epimerase
VVGHGCVAPDMTDMTRLLDGKTAIIYGAGGSLGGGVARMTAAIANVTCGLVG